MTRSASSGGKPLVISVVRNGRYVELPPARPQSTDGVYTLGFHPSAVRYKRYGPVHAVGLAGKDTWLVTKAMGSWLTPCRQRFGPQGGLDPGGDRAASRARRSQVGYREYLQVLALISLSLALLNLLPLLPLDGGHMAFSIIEGLRGRAVGRRGLRTRLRGGNRPGIAALLRRPLERHRQYQRGLDSRRGQRTRHQSRRRLDRRRRACRRAVDDADEDPRRRGHDRPDRGAGLRPAARSCAWRCRRARTPTRCRRSFASRRCR